MSSKPRIGAAGWAAAFVLALAALQAAVGNVPSEAFAFPVNAALGAAWLYCTWFAWRFQRGRKAVGALMSGRASVAAMALTALTAVAAGIIPQTGAAEGVWGRMGVHALSESWFMRGAVLLLLTNLTGVLLTRLRRPRAGFVLSHAGLWLALTAGFWGAADRTAIRMQLFPGLEQSRGYTAGGGTRLLPFELTLESVDARFYPDGSPQSYSARLAADGERLETSVNRPARHKGYDLYIVSCDAERPRKPRYCIIEAVRDPWQPAQAVGIAMLIGGAAVMFVQGGAGKPKKRLRT